MSASAPWRRQVARRLLPALLVAALGAVSAAAAPDKPLLLKAAKVLTLAGEPLAPGQVLVRDGRIAAVGAALEAPPGATVLDLPGAVVMPGLVAAFSTLCETDRHPDESLTPELRLSDGVDYYRDWRRLLAGGVTTVYLAPGRRRLVPGQGAVIKLTDGKPSSRLLRETAGLHVVLGEWPKEPPDLWDPPLAPTGDRPTADPVHQLPTTRAGELQALQELLRQAREGKLTGPRGAAVQAALKGESLVRVRAERAEDLRNALALAEQFGLRLVIEGGTEGYALAAELAARHVPVVLTPLVRPGGLVAEDFALAGVLGELRPDNAARLAAAGVPLALSAEDGSLPELLALAGTLVGTGLPARTALRAVTTQAAELLGVADRIGSLEVGKEADLLVLSADPLATAARVELTIVDGRVVYRRQEQAAPADPAAAGRWRVFRAAQVHTGTGDVIAGGEVRVCGGRVVAVGPRQQAPPGAEVIDLGEGVLMPGMIDLQSHLGLHWESDSLALVPPPPDSGGGAARQTSIAGAVDPTDPAFALALQAGVTTVALAPADGGLYCGSVAVLKTAGATLDERTVRAVAALKFDVTGDRDRAALRGQIRDLLERARKYERDWDDFAGRWAEFERRYQARPAEEFEEPARPGRDNELELLRPLLRGEVPALVVAERTDEVDAALQVFAGEFGLRTILCGLRDADRVATRPRLAGAAVGPWLLREERGREYNRAVALDSAGVAVAFQTCGASGSAFLRQTAAYAVRHGLAPRAALQGLTSVPARLLGLQKRLGSLEPGCDADLVVLSGDPLELTSTVDRVFIKGELAYERSTPQ